MLTSEMKAAITGGDVDPRYGGFNDFPPHWEPCSTSEFWGKFSSYGPGNRSEFRQMGRLDGKWVRGQAGTNLPLLSAHLFFYGDGSGLAVSVDYNYVSRDGETDYTYTPSFFKFTLCQHDFESTVSRMHYNESTCRKCGYVKIVDSSG